MPLKLAIFSLGKNFGRLAFNPLLILAALDKIFVKIMQYICDLHIHSPYARACSKELTLTNIDRWAKLKGINIIGTGDFSHPARFKEIENNLVEKHPGLFQLKGSATGTLFMLTNEISCIYSQGGSPRSPQGEAGKVRRVHICILAPGLDFVRRLNEQLTKRGCKLGSDGRPIIGMSAKELLKICLEIDEYHLSVPAHAWTPWFAIFGSKSGFDSIAECYEELANHIYAIETGLSSDPLMNWRLSALDKVALVSNSDAHSLENLGREANVFDLSEPSFKEIHDILKNRDKKKFLYTIEFFPEEGMYHYDGHRQCQVSLAPEQTKKYQGICPQCKKPLTIGVLNRVDKLADRQQEKIDKNNFIPYKSLIPLREILGEVYNVGKQSKKVEVAYLSLVQGAGSEFNVLLNSTPAELTALSSARLAEAITRVREGRVKLIPGFDGQYGKIEIFSKTEKEQFGQRNLF